MKGILALKNPTGELFEGVIEIPSDKAFYEKQLERDDKRFSLKVRVTSDFPDQLRCAVGEEEYKILFEFNWLTTEVSKAIGRNLWTGRFSAWTASFERL